jgi:hypothetical protein
MTTGTAGSGAPGATAEDDGAFAADAVPLPAVVVPFEEAGAADASPASAAAPDERQPAAGNMAREQRTTKAAKVVVVFMAICEMERAEPVRS